MISLWTTNYDQHRWTKRAFIPERDITVYELAEIVSNMTAGSSSVGLFSNTPLPPRAGIDFRDDVWQEIPDRIKRHFKEIAP